MANPPERLMVRNGTFYANIPVPKDVAPYGRQLVVTSLRTNDLKTVKSRLARKSVEGARYANPFKDRLLRVGVDALD